MATRKINLDVTVDGGFALRDSSRKVGSLQQFYKSPTLESEPILLYNRNVLVVQESLRSANTNTHSLGPAGMPAFVRSSQIMMHKIRMNNGVVSVLVSNRNAQGSQHYIVDSGAFFNLGDVASSYITPVNIIENTTKILLRNSTNLLLPAGYALTGDPLPAGLSFIEFTGGDAGTAYKPKVNVKAIVGLAADTEGYCVYGTYALMWKDNRLYWSSPLEYWQFTPAPSLAGSTLIADAKGTIVHVIRVTNGILIFCKHNTVYGVYTGDPTNPFSFSEVSDAGAIEVVPAASSLVPKIAWTEDDSNPEYVIVVTDKGLQIISENRVLPLPPKLTEYLRTNTVESKAANSATVVRSVLDRSSGGLQQSSTESAKINFMYFLDNILYMSVSIAIPTTAFYTQSRLFMYDFTTDTASICELLCKGFFQPLVGYNFHNSPGANLPSNYKFAGSVGIVKGIMSNSPSADSITYQLIRLNTISSLLPPNPTGVALLATALFLIGDISISPDTTTVIESIRLIGDSADSSGANRATVKVYSVDINGPNAPVEFVYYAATDTYYGIIEGRKLQIEVEGNYFYLQSIEVEIASGGLR